MTDRPDPGTDVLIVGGGPAGSTVAGLLAARGWRVRVLDRARFPRPKPCGECLNPGAVRALERLGLLARVEALGPARLEGWRIGDGERSADGSFPGGAGGLALPRALLDRALLDAARSEGAEVEEGVRVLAVEARGDPARGAFARVAVREGGVRSTRSARILVGADGLRSVVARGVDAPRGSPRLRKLSITLHLEGVSRSPRRGCLRVDDRGTVGLAPLDRAGRRWNATVVVDADTDGRRVAGNPEAFALTRLTEVLGPPGSWRVVDGPWTSGPFDWPARHAVAGGVVLVGDAAGYYDPLTGQGIYRALRSGELAAAAIDTALRARRESRPRLGGYQARLRREIRPALRVQKGVEWVLSRKALRTAALGALGRAPRALGTLIGVTGDCAPARALLRPRTWSQLLPAGHG